MNDSYKDRVLHLNEGIRSTKGKGAMDDLDSMVQQTKDNVYVTLKVQGECDPQVKRQIEKVAKRHGFEVTGTNPKQGIAYLHKKIDSPKNANREKKNITVELEKDLSKTLGFNVTVSHVGIGM